MHAEPTERSAFETVPDPTIVPADQPPGSGGVGDQLAEVERHLPTVRMTEPLPAALDTKRQVDPAVAPGVAEFVRRHRDRRERS